MENATVTEKRELSSDGNSNTENLSNQQLSPFHRSVICTVKMHSTVTVST